jgi:hypothetical protein
MTNVKQNHPGGWPGWVINKERLNEFKEKYNLKPEIEHSIQKNAEISPLNNMMRRIVLAGPYPIATLAHFHLDDNVYLISEELWPEFSKMVILEFSKAMGNVKSISFNIAKELGSTMMQMDH